MLLYIIPYEYYEYRSTYSYEISLDEQLRHGNRVRAETFSDLLLHLSTHEDVSFHKLDQVCPQNLSDLQTSLIRVSDNAHGGRVQYDFAGFFFLPRLKRECLTLIF